MTEPAARIHEQGGAAIICAADRYADANDAWFDRERWREAGAVTEETSGRGAVLIVERGAERWAIRHYHRGGLVAKVIEDHYLWLGLERTRAFREWRLLAALAAAGLPVPSPVAARVRRTGPIYTADIITRYLPDTRRLSAHLVDGGPPAEVWERIGRTVKAFHARGVRHPDLNAHNILLDSRGTVFLVDFDNAALAPPGRWQRAGLARLERSLRKVAMETGTDFDPAAWAIVERAYRDAPGLLR